MFVANNFTAIASKITPKTFLIMLIPLVPINRSIFADVFKTMYINITLHITAMIIF